MGWVGNAARCLFATSSNFKVPPLHSGGVLQAYLDFIFVLFCLDAKKYQKKPIPTEGRDASS
jgi:hypothetical protein